MAKATSGDKPAKKKNTGTKKKAAAPGIRQRRRKNVPASKQAWEDGIGVETSPN